MALYFGPPPTVSYHPVGRPIDSFELDFSPQPTLADLIHEERQQVGRTKDPQELAFLQTINTAKTSEEAADARRVMADWCDERGQIKRGRWLRTTADLMLVYPNIHFSKRVGWIDCTFGDWFGELSHDALASKWWGLSGGHFDVSNDPSNYSAGPIIASMLPLQEVRIGWDEDDVWSYHKFDAIAEFLGFQECDWWPALSAISNVNRIAKRWARYIASGKIRLLRHYQQMRSAFKPLPRTFSLHDTKGKPYCPLADDSAWQFYQESRAANGQYLDEWQQYVNSRTTPTET